MGSKHQRASKATASKPLRWIAHGFTRGVITLPNGPIELGGGWQLIPANDEARSSRPFLILESPNTMMSVADKREWPSLRLTGTVEATSKEEALEIAEAEMDSLVGLLCLATTGSFDAITGVQVALADSGRHLLGKAGLSQTPAVPVKEDEIKNMEKLHSWWTYIRASDSREAVQAALGWYRYTTFVSHHSLRILMAWSAAEALAHAFPTPKAERNCEHCGHPLVCSECGSPSYRTEPYESVKELLTKHYGVLSKKDFEKFAKARGRAAHGGRSPKEGKQPTQPLLDALYRVFVQALRDLGTETTTD